VIGLANFPLIFVSHSGSLLQKGLATRTLSEFGREPLLLVLNFQLNPGHPLEVVKIEVPPMKSITSKLCGRQWIVLSIFTMTLLVQRAQAQAPVFEIAPIHSSIKFHVKSSLTLAVKFDKWDASLTFTSPDERMKEQVFWK
jgi:hypothetical protein